MLLVLNVQLYRNAPLAPQVGRFAEGGGSIGRSPGNVLVLDDPAKYISRTHALVTFRAGQFFLADTGSNPSVVNDRPLGIGREVALASGDRVTIGDYQLQVQIDSGTDILAAGFSTDSGADPSGLISPAELPANVPLFEPPPRASVVLPALENFGKPDAAPPNAVLVATRDALAGANILDSPAPGRFSSTADPLGLNLFGTPTGTQGAVQGASEGDALGVGFRGSANDHAAPERFAMPLPAAPVHVPPLIPEPYAPVAGPALSPLSSLAPPAEKPATPGAGWYGAIPDDYDPLADFMPASRAPAAPPVATAPFGGAGNISPATSVLQLPADFDPLAAPGTDAAMAPAHASPVELEGVMPPPQGACLPDVDFLAPVSVAPITTAEFAAPESVALQTPPAGPPEALPVAPAAAVALAPSAVPAPVTAPAQAPVSDSASADPTLAALLRGLGLPDLQTRLSAQELAELVGAMLREATGGLMQTLMARSVSKRESRVEMTMIASQANNPLKFFPDAGSALSQMLSQKATGYMKPVRAFGNAFEDLQAHELAVMAGMRAALAAVLQRFDPEAIEQRLEVPTVMDKMMASSRKAKMWDRLVSLYADITREADDDFQRLFGESFAKAYEEQVDRMHRSK